MGAAIDEREWVGDAVEDRAGGRRGVGQYRDRGEAWDRRQQRPQVAQRFVRDRLDGLLDEPRPGRPRTVADEQVEAVITRTLETTPKDATHWSTRSLAAELGMSQSAVSRIWRAFGLQPHRQDSWKLSKDPQFIDKVRDVVGLYLDPPEAAVVLCVDEKSQIQALDRTAPILPMMPGTPARATHDYNRHGTSSLYAALDIASGQVIGSLHGRHRADRVQEVPADDRRRGAGRLRRARRARQRLHPQDTGRQTLAASPPPLRAALHPDQLLLAQPGRTLVRRTDHQETAPRHPPLRAPLNADIRTWIDTWNDNPRPYVWTKTADQILDSIGRYCTRINDSGH